MPMIWDAAADAKLLSKIFEICEVTVAEPQKQQLASIMGCTPKAITHRIAKIKNANGSSGPAEVKKGGGVKKVSTKGKGSKGLKQVAGASEDQDDAEGEEDGAGALTPPPSGRGSKKRKIKAEPSEDGDGIEMGEDIGEGLRKGRDGAESEDEF